MTRAYETAMARWLALGCDDTGQFMLLKTMADEAKLDLDILEVQIAQHQNAQPLAGPGISPPAILLPR